MHKIRPLDLSDRKHWEELYYGYAQFYQTTINAVILDTLWQWIFDENHPLAACVCESDSQIVALAHYRSMPSPLRGKEIGFLDDLYVHPDHRGKGIGKALLLHIHSIAQAQGWGVVRWITRDNNHTAKHLYDQLAKKTDWNLYELIC